MQTPNPDWYVRPYQPGDEEQLVALFAQVFGRPRSIAAWRWKLLGRQAAFNTVWVAVTNDEERIIGQYGGIPLHVKLGDTIHPAVHAVEAMTAPQYRRQGMLTALGSAAHEGWAEAGQEIVLGLPNEQWGTRNRALGYIGLFPLGWLRFPLHVERVIVRPGRLPRPLVAPAAALGAAGSTAWRRLSIGKMRRQRGGAEIEVKEIAAPCPELDLLWASLSRKYTNLVVRDSAWIEWRFLRSAAYQYKVLLARSAGEPVGYLAYRLSQSPERVNGYIADLFTAPGDSAATSALLEAALDDLSKRGAGTVMATAPPRTSLHHLLKSLGFLTVRGAFNFELIPLHANISPARLSDPTAWHLTAGDFDVI